MPFPAQDPGADEDDQRLFGEEDDQFELGPEIGHGSQATIHVCTRLRSGNRYAVKIYNTAPVLASPDGQNMQRELRNLEALCHPRIVNLQRVFWEPERCLMVMDHAPCGDLYGRIEQEVQAYGTPYRGLGGAEYASKHVAYQLIDGIGFMHDHKIIHRDLKLENILVVQSYPCLTEHVDNKPRDLLEVKIADLGFSKMITNDDGVQPDVPRMHSAVGSPEFIAPEVLDQSYDERADYWSFGVMLYCMLCGTWPFRINGPDDLRPERHCKLVSQLRVCKSYELASPEARSMVQGLLTVDVSQRLGRDDCLRNPWLVDELQNQVSPRMSRRRSRERLYDDQKQLIEIDEGHAGVVREIHASTGCAVNSMELEFADGSLKSYGEQGGEDKGRWFLKEEEFIIGVMQEMRSTYLGNCIVLYTSESQIIPIEGGCSHRRQRFVAPRGTQITGLQFKHSSLVGIHTEDTVNGEGLVDEIGGWAGNAVNKVTMKLRDESMRDYGRVGGQAQGPWGLAADEFVVVVEQALHDADAFLGTEMCFYTNLGSFIRLVGVEAACCRRFMVPPGHQICDLQFDGSDLATVSTCPESGNMNKVEHHKVVLGSYLWRTFPPCMHML